MEETDHKLILDYWNGRFHPRCGCGRWQKAPVPIRVQKLREVYDRIEDEHFRHVEEVERHQAAPAHQQQFHDTADPGVSCLPVPGDVSQSVRNRVLATLGQHADPAKDQHASE